MWGLEGISAGGWGGGRGSPGPCFLLRAGSVLCALGGWDITQLQAKRGRLLAAGGAVIYSSDLVTVYI